MTMAEEIDSIYMNLNELLNDICEFLDNEVNKEVLSPGAKKKAELLITRSKKQISILETECKTGGYMLMDRKISVTEELPKYTDDILSTMRSVSTAASESNLLFSDLPARNLPNDEKNGYLSWKIKMIFGFERVQKIYAGIFEHYLLVYRSDKDSKPFHTYNLHNHQASPINKQALNETRFLLFNIESKTANQFIAQTPKDMVQWVVKINRCNQEGKQKKIESIRDSEGDTSSHSEDEGEYNSIIINEKPSQSAVNTEESEEEEVYEVLLETRIPPVEHPPSQIYPIPNRLQRTPLPPLPVEESNSFSEDDELIYDELTCQVAEESQQIKPPPKKIEVSPTKPVIVPKPRSNLTKPRIDVKIITHSPYGKNSTKKIMKIAQETSLKN